MDRLIIATNNQGKAQEIKEVLYGLPYDIVSLKDIGLNINVIEDRPDFKGNALKKAKEISLYTKEIVLADDSGLVVEVLNGAPGVYSARFAGENASDADNNNKLLEMLKNTPMEERRATFKCVLVMVFPNGRIIDAEGECSGKIGYIPVGENGFGYDPLFITDEYNKTMAQLTAKEKNAISHRGKALGIIKKKLTDIIDKT